MQELYHHGVLGMKWGIRRYQPYGKGGYDPKHKGKNVGEAKRSAKDMSDDDLQKSVKRMNLEQQYKKLSKQSAEKGRLEKTKDVVDEASNAANRMRNVARSNNQPKTTWERMDLSNMTDQQLRDAINRENLEIQYSQLFNKKQTQVSAGELYAGKILDAGADVLAIGSSALGIALAIKALKG